MDTIKQIDERREYLLNTKFYKINLNELTPIDALNTLVKIKEKMK